MSPACEHAADNARALCLLQLRADPQYRRIAQNRHVALVEAALDDGNALADTARQQWGQDPLAIASYCNVPVTCSELDASYGSVTVYAEYINRPPSIKLYLPAIRRLEELIAGSPIQLRLANTSALSIFLAHELYHHFDCLRGEARLSRQHRVPILGIGKWVWTSGLESLAEIAAGAFAQRLLGLTFHPAIFDLLLAESQGEPAKALEHA